MNWQSHRDSGSSSSLGRGQKSWAAPGAGPRSRGPGQPPMQSLVAA